MATSDQNLRGQHEREARLEEIKKKLQELAGGRMRCWESSTMPLEDRERFWEDVLEFEERGSRRRR